MATSPYPPHRPVSVAESRSADREAALAGVPGLVLMEHAGRGLAHLAAGRRRGPGPVLVICGPGNNGGDGYAAARFLASWGIPTRVVGAGAVPAPRSDAAQERQAYAREGPIESIDATSDDARAAIESASLVLDALFGTGLSRPLGPPFTDWIARMNESSAPRIAADVPSGLDADDGHALPCAVRADVTAAMGLVKRGCVTPAGAAWCGEILEIDIGLPRSVHAKFLRV